jgi:hypothetical protein
MTRIGAFSSWLAHRSGFVKFLILQSVFCAVCLTYIVTANFEFSSFIAKTDRIVDNDLKRSVIAYEIASDLDHTALAVKDLLLSDSPEDLSVRRAAYERNLQKAQEDVDFLMNNVKNAERKVMIRTIAADLRDYKNTCETVISLQNEGNKEAALSLANKNAVKLREKLVGTLSAMIESYKSDIEENREKINSQGGSAQIGNILIALLILPVACFILWFGIR